MNDTSGQPERLVCDTGIVNAIYGSKAKPQIIEHWPESKAKRIDSAILAISVVTLAEVRMRGIKAGWKAEGIERLERALEAYVWLPVDQVVINECAGLLARYRKQMGDNDLWVAATAKAHGWPVVTADLEFCALTAEVEVFYVPAKPDSAVECP